MTNYSRVFLTFVIIALVAVIASAEYSFKVDGDWVYGSVVTLEFESTEKFAQGKSYLFASTAQTDATGTDGPWFFNFIEMPQVFKRIVGGSICYGSDDKIVAYLAPTVLSSFNLNFFAESSKAKCKVRLLTEYSPSYNYRLPTRAITYKTVQPSGSVAVNLSSPVDVSYTGWKKQSIGDADLSVKFNNKVLFQINPFLEVTTLELSVAKLPKNAVIRVTASSAVTGVPTEYAAYTDNILKAVDGLLFAPIALGYNQNLKCADSVRIMLDPRRDSSFFSSVLIVTGDSPKDGKCAIPITKGAFSSAFSAYNTVSNFKDIDVKVTLEIGGAKNITTSLGKLESKPITVASNLLGSMYFVQVGKDKGYFAIDKIYGDQDLFKDSTGTWLSPSIKGLSIAAPIDEINTDVEGAMMAAQNFEQQMIEQYAMVEQQFPGIIKIKGVSELKLGSKPKNKLDRANDYVAVVMVNLAADKVNSPSAFDYTFGSYQGYLSNAPLSRVDSTVSEITYKDGIVTQVIGIKFPASASSAVSFPVRSRFVIRPTFEFRSKAFECTASVSTITVSTIKYDNDDLDELLLSMYEVEGTVDNTNGFNITCTSAASSIAARLTYLQTTVVWSPRGSYGISAASSRLNDMTAIKAKFPAITTFTAPLVIDMVIPSISSSDEFKTNVQLALDLWNSAKSDSDPVMTIDDLRFRSNYVHSLFGSFLAWSSSWFGRNIVFDAIGLESYTDKGAFLSFAVRSGFLPTTTNAYTYANSKGFNGILVSDKAIVKVSSYGGEALDVPIKFFDPSSLSTTAMSEQQATYTDADLSAAIGGITGSKCESTGQCIDGQYCYKGVCTEQNELDMKAQLAILAVTGQGAQYQLDLYSQNSIVGISSVFAIVIAFVALLF